MSLREDALAILRYQPYRHMPIVHFGFWNETLLKWQAEGHITESLDPMPGDGSPVSDAIASRLGFDFNWYTVCGGHYGLRPGFTPRVLEELPNGQIKSIDANGAIILTKPGIVSIPSEVGHLLCDRTSWEEHFLPRLQYEEARILESSVKRLSTLEGRDRPYGLMMGSLIGDIRNWLGVEGLAYLQADDEDLFVEIVDTYAGLQYRVAAEMLARGAKPDFGHFWEDICFKTGPLIRPDVLAERMGPWYRKMTDLLGKYGVDIVSLDCDGKIDTLVPIWLENGVNTMFPIEVGTWSGNIADWRALYGRDVRGVGGMNKTVFAQDRAAIDREIERLRSLIDLGGYIPCPDHRIAPDAIWENVQYYCDRLRTVLSRS